MLQKKSRFSLKWHILAMSVLGLVSLVYATKFYIHPVQAATTYTVSNNNDSGIGSLRQAIEDANANPGADIIVFDAAYTIQPTSELPYITDQVEINGYTGSPGGATANSAVAPAPFNGTLTIEIDGTNAGLAAGLVFSDNSDGSSVRGLVINRFESDGIAVQAPNITIAGNYIGTSLNGLVDQGNASRGIGDSGAGTADNITIGGLTAADRNIISGNDEGGASPNTGDDTWIFKGNYIGVGADGLTAIPNAQPAGSGALSLDNSIGHVVGGSSAGAINVISGNNSHGIAPYNTTDVVITGNYIGTDYTGAAALANGGAGITVGQDASLTIGGATANDRNIISGNSGEGIYVGSTSDGVTISGNYIGTNAAGTGAVANARAGVSLGQSSTHITVGGTSSGERNVISGNTQDGIIMYQAGAGNSVQGNYIGTNAAGTGDLGNGDRGVDIDQTEGVTVGGSMTGAGNVISGNSGDGIRAINVNNGVTIAGNYIGTNAAGTGAVANGLDGVNINGTDNSTIGGTASTTRNVISGNTGDGVDFVNSSTSNTLSGNYIGTNAAGTAAIANGVHGVAMATGSLTNTIGGNIGLSDKGDCTGSCNVISGNTVEGVNLNSDTGAGNKILNNYIGIDYTGLADLGNGGAGIRSNHSGATTMSGNTISGNESVGVHLQGSNASVQSNYIGFNSARDATIKNTGGSSSAQVQISGDFNTFGGLTAGQGNFVAGATNISVLVIGLTPFGGDTAQNNMLFGNCIGTNASCQPASSFGAINAGVSLLMDTQNTLIGAYLETYPSAGNTIAGNGTGIVNIGYSTYYPTNNSIMGNSIYGNSGGTPSSIGIDNLQTNDFSTYTNAGVTLNDDGDIDYAGTNSGPNHYLNFPVINSVSSSNGQATINYSLDINDSESGATGYRVEFFANDAADPSGYGEGQTYLGFDTVSGDVTSHSVTITLPTGVSGDKFIAATTTMLSSSLFGVGHTSEFSADLAAALVPVQSGSGGGAGASANLADTGQEVLITVLVSLVLIISGGLGVYVYKSRLVL